MTVTLRLLLEGSNGSNSEIHVQDRKIVREMKQPNWMTSCEFVSLVNDNEGGYCMSLVSDTEAVQSNKQKQWLKAMNKELASLKENETWDFVNRPSTQR
jgi:hypothetical protein